MEKKKIKRTITARFKKVCEVCGVTFEAKKSNAKTCGPTCRSSKRYKSQVARFNDQEKELKRSRKELKRADDTEKLLREKKERLIDVEGRLKVYREYVGEQKRKDLERAWELHERITSGKCKNCGKVYTECKCKQWSSDTIYR